MRTVVAGLACLPLLACIDRSLSELPSTSDTVEKKTVAISLNNELDLLFVVDNSGSMEQEHTSLESRFPELIRAVDALVAAGNTQFYVEVLRKPAKRTPRPVASTEATPDPESDFED